MGLEAILEGLKDYVSSWEAEKQERLASRLFPRAIREEYSKEEAVSLFDRLGFNVGTERLSQLYDTVEGRELRAGRVRFVNRSAQIKEDILDVDTFFSDRKYRFVAQYSIYDETADEWFTKFHSIETDTLGTRGYIEQQIYNSLIGLYDFQEDNIDNISLRYGIQNIRIE